MPPSRRPRRPSPSVSIVIPVRDAAGLPPMLRTLPAADEVILVTAAPVPEAAVVAACPGALLVRQTRSGLGNALACGVAASTGDVVVTLDGDGATDPGEMRRYVDALTDGADMAVGSRYCDGGRDLTTGRFRRGLNLALTWLLNTLYGVRRTDPGFGYTAFWRDSLDHLALPDPSAPLPVWGDGPEIEALLAVRAAARGLTVTEVPGVAYPRMRRSSRHDRTTVRHWLRALTTEFRGRSAHPARHSATNNTAGTSDSAAVHSGELSTGAPHDLRFSARIETGGGPRRLGKDQPSRNPASKDQPSRNPAARNPVGNDRVANDPVEPIWGPPRRTPEPADLWLADIPAPLDRPARPRPAPPLSASALPTPGLPIPRLPIPRLPIPRLPIRRQPAAPDRPVTTSAPTTPDQPVTAWAPTTPDQPVTASAPTTPDQPVTASAPTTPDQPVTASAPTTPDQPVIASVPAARTSDIGPVTGRRQDEGRRDEAGAAEPRREVGTRRRHLEGYRQRPELRVITGEGTGSGRSRSGRLRAVPPRETTGGRPGPQ